MHILMLSWRDISHSKSGGAEVFTHEMLSRLVHNGYTITHISQGEEGLPVDEYIDGVRYLRCFTDVSHWFYRWTNFSWPFAVIQFARQWYGHNSNQIDIVIDQSNTHQFFTPLWLPRSQCSVLFVHQLTREIWFHHLPFPLALLGYLLEPLLLYIHRNSFALTVSNSTQEGLLRYGFNSERIAVLPEGLDFSPWDSSDLLSKEPTFTCMYIGRFARYKGVEDCIVAFAQLYSHTDIKARLWLVGRCSPEYRTLLEDLIERLCVTDAVVWHGFVSDNDKKSLMSRCHCICVPSQREGWGLVVTEANAVGTIAVVYPSPGLRDSVRDTQTGLITADKTPESLCYTLVRLWHAPVTRAAMEEAAHAWSYMFDWDTTGDEADKALRSFLRFQTTIKS